jgi:hypothetical protein
MEEIMKIFHSAVLALAIGAASISSAYARDSFSLGINVGGYGYAPPPVMYYPAPVYYSEPVYYRSSPTYYRYAPTVVSFGYQNYGGYRHHGWGHEEREHHGWNRGRDRHDGSRGRWERGDHGGGHHDGGRHDGHH